MDCLLNTGVPGLGRPGSIITDPPEQFPGEFPPATGVFAMLALAGLGVGSGLVHW